MPLLLTAIVLGLSGRQASIVSSTDGPVPTGVELVLPSGYTTTSPISRTLDVLSVLSIPQSVWLLCGFAFLVLCSAAWSVRNESPKRIFRKLLKTFAVIFIATAITEAIVILVPRPMAMLAVSDRDVVRVDFHSHTKASHDAYQRFTSERNREWHQSGGFDIAFITDHVKWGGAIEAAPRNPKRAGERVSLLTAVEGHYRKTSTILLALVRQDTAILTGWGELEEGKTPSIGRQPVAIVAIPGRIDSVASTASAKFPEFTGIELVDAAPRGLSQLDRQEDQLREIARKNRLILVASSNNHGWGRTVVAWNLMRVPGWRDLSPDSVGHLIEAPFRARDTTGVTIIKRVRPRTHGLSLPLTLPVAAYQTVGALTPDERWVWLIYIWLIAGVVMIRRKSI